MWTCNITNHVMVDLDIVIALVIMTFMVVINFYKSHSMKEIVFNDFINET